MKKSLLLSFLAVSLAMNVGVAAMLGLGAGRLERDKTAKASPLAACDEHLYTLLGLSQEQTASLAPEVEAFHERVAALSNSMHERRNSLIALLERDQVEQAELERAGRDMASLQASMQQNFIGHILRMKQVMNEEQREQFFRMMRQRSGEQGLGCAQ